MSLQNKVVVVTGASRGLGRELCWMASTAGAKVVALARSESTQMHLVDEMRSQHREVLPVVGDVSQPADIDRLVQQALDTYGGIDVVVHNAGVGVFKSVVDLDVDDYDRVMDVNVKGTFLLTKAVVPHMRERRRGHLVAIVSDVGKRTFANGSVYCASKFAQRAFMDAVRQEVQQDGVRVSCVYPGLIDTSFADSEQGADYKEHWLKASDVAASVRHLLEAPPHVLVDELQLHPTSQRW